MLREKNEENEKGDHFVTRTLYPLFFPLFQRRRKKEEI